MDLYTQTEQNEKEQEEAASILAMDTKVVSEAVYEIKGKARERLHTSSTFKIKDLSESKN